MLKLDKITKIYKIEEFEQRALDSVSIDFRQNEFVSILGPSGSGKTTLLSFTLPTNTRRIFLRRTFRKNSRTALNSQADRKICALSSDLIKTRKPQ